MASRKQNGFSLLELAIALSISMILAAVTIYSFQPVFKEQHVNDAYNTTLTSLRRARDAAAADMRVYVVSFTAPGTITVTETSVGGTLLFSETLPPDVTYHIEPGIPTSPTVAPTTPDGFGSGANYFDFDQGIGAAGGSTIYFQPDGTALDINGNINNGVVYLGIPGQLNTCRAVTLWGYTSRIRGWALSQTAGVWSWRQQ
jgi:prepilin-type N-terminal cleavage/methylation domain-containing protein